MAQRLLMQAVASPIPGARLPDYDEECHGMNWREFKQAGHWPTLLSAFLYFDVSFMAWVVLGPLMLYLGQELGLSVEDKFTLVAIPLLAGALLRVPMGMLADHLGPKRTGQFGQLVVITGLAYAWLFGLGSKLEVEILGLVLGVAGASFAVALPQASRWYPPKYQGVVMGIAGAGNMGVVLDSMFVPWIAEQYGWEGGFGVLLIPLVLVFLFYTVMAKDAPEQRASVTLANYATVFRDVDTWWFMFFYSITFGGFVGLGSALPLYFTTWYHTSGIAAGLMAALVVFAGSMFRPVPLRFRNEIGVMSGLVGAAGGAGGFLLAKTLGWSKAMSGGFAPGFWVFAGLAALGVIGLLRVKTRWRTTWGAASGARV